MIQLLDKHPSCFPVIELKDWFLRYGRDLPWRKERTPYRVWISEVMLQQTQVSVVIPYFENWMRVFPTVRDLASASSEQVIKMWEGLGYYSRARNIHKAARYFVEHHNGLIPEDPVILRKVPGFGPYTCGAVLSFAFQKKYAAVDGNVMRVLSRYFGIRQPIDRTAVKKMIYELAEAVLPEHEPWVIAEGLIELGALICAKAPECAACPLESTCYAAQNHLQTKLPIKQIRQPTSYLTRIVAIIIYNGLFCVKQGEKGRVMYDLYEFPFLEFCPEHSVEEAVQAFSKELDLKLFFIRSLSIQKHSFTRYHATLYPYMLNSLSMQKNYDWKSKDELQKLPFSSGHRKILQEVCNIAH